MSYKQQQKPEQEKENKKERDIVKIIIKGKYELLITWKKKK